MLRRFFMLMTLCLAGAVCAPTQAAAVVFSGTFTNAPGGAFDFGSGNNQFSVTAFFTPGVGIASITSAVLTAGSGLGQQTWTLGAGGTLKISSPVTDQVTLNLPGSGLSVPGGLTFGGLSLTLNASNTSGHVNSSDWDTVYSANQHIPGSVSGAVALGGSFYSFQGAAVPEPGSVALLSGLGVVFGVARRRRQARTTVA